MNSLTCCFTSNVIGLMGNPVFLTFVITRLTVVYYSVVLCVITQRSSHVLRDDTNNGCVADEANSGNIVARNFIKECV